MNLEISLMWVALGVYFVATLLFVFGVSDFYDDPGSNETGTLTAYDAMTGAVVWSKTTSGSGGHASASPAVDPDRQYVYGAGQDGKVHKYHVGNGQEVTGGGWPVTVTLKPDQENMLSKTAKANPPLPCLKRRARGW